MSLAEILEISNTLNNHNPRECYVRQNTEYYTSAARGGENNPPPPPRPCGDRLSGPVGLKSAFPCSRFV